jgi:alkylated DNA nucleotide flippase Atl1
MTYGLIAEVVHEQLGRGGAIQVGQVMAGNFGLDGEYPDVPWWRVVNAAGHWAPGYRNDGLQNLLSEQTPMSADGNRVNVKAAIWFP